MSFPIVTDVYLAVSSCCLTLVTEWPPAGCVLKSFDYLWLVIICMTPAFVFSMQDLFGHNTSSLHFDIMIYYQESPHLTFFLAITELDNGCLKDESSTNQKGHHPPWTTRWGASQDPTQLVALPNSDECVRCSETWVMNRHVETFDVHCAVVFVRKVCAQSMWKDDKHTC